MQLELLTNKKPFSFLINSMDFNPRFLFTSKLGRGINV